MFESWIAVNDDCVGSLIINNRKLKPALAKLSSATLQRC